MPICGLAEEYRECDQYYKYYKYYKDNKLVKELELGMAWYEPTYWNEATKNFKIDASLDLHKDNVRPDGKK